MKSSKESKRNNMKSSIESKRTSSNSKRSSIEKKRSSRKIGENFTLSIIKMGPGFEKIN